MSFLDNIRDRLRPAGDDYYDDEYYDDYDEPQDSRGDSYESGGLLGNSRRPEAESVAVYTRSGRLVDGTPSTSAPSSASYGRDVSYQPSAAARPSYAPRTDYRDSYAAEETTSIPAQPQRDYGSPDSLLGNTTGGHTPGDIGLKPVPRVNSGQLPPYVLKPVSYELEEVTMPVSGEMVEMLKREELGQPQPVSGPVVTTIQLSSSKAFMPGRMWCSRISAAMTLPPKVRLRSSSVHGNRECVRFVRSTNSTLPI